MIRLEGMGIQGCLLAMKLAQNDLEFTWYDSDAEHTAWKASTGAIYPSGSTKFGPDEDCRRVWKVWHDNHLTFGCTERATWIFNSKKPPHGGKYGSWRIGLGRLGIAEESACSFHLNSQKLVRQVRAEFHHLRTSEPARREHDDTVVVTHGFGARMSHAYWGWTKKVHLKYPRYISEGLRPAFYFREGLLNMSYAYPVPGETWWYAGSSLIKQQPGKLKSLDAEKHYQRWKANFLRMGAGHVHIAFEDVVTFEGWRPAAADEDKKWVTVSSQPGYTPLVFTMRPLWNSGIRHFPKQWAELARMLNIDNPVYEREVA